MLTAGLKEVETAKQDGRWKAAYDSASKMVIPDDFLKQLAKNEQAKAFFDIGGNQAPPSCQFGVVFQYGLQ